MIRGIEPPDWKRGCRRRVGASVSRHLIGDGWTDAERAARGGDGAEARRREVIRSQRQGEGKPAVVALRVVGADIGCSGQVGVHGA